MLLKAKKFCKNAFTENIIKNLSKKKYPRTLKKNKKKHQIIDVKKLQGHRLLDGQPLSGVGLRCTF